MRYEKSTAFLKLAESVVPLGSQTFSKSKVQYPVGIAPQFIERGCGARVWDIDGNEYVDFVNSLLATSIGHRNEAVDTAVREQLEKGVSFSLPTRLEYQVASLLVEIVPCCEMVRFGKNGSDATSAAIRLSSLHRERASGCLRLPWMARLVYWYDD